MGDVLEELAQSRRLSELQPVVPEALLVGLHGIGDGAGAGDGIEAQLVQLVVPAEDVSKIVVADAAPQQDQRLQLRPLHLPALHVHGPGALDGTGEAALVDDVLFLRQGLAVDQLELVVSAGAVILGGQHAPHLHGADQARRAHPGQLVAGQGVAAEILEPLLVPLFVLFGMGHPDLVGTGGGDGLQVLPAEHRAHARAARGPLAAEDGAVEDQVLASGTDHQLAEGPPGAPLLHQERFQLLLALGDLQSPEPVLVRVVEGEPAVVDLQPGMLLTPALQDEGVDARLLQVIAEAAAAVGRGEDPRLGGDAGEIEPARGGRARARQGARGDHDPVLLREGLLLAGQMVAQNLGSHDLAADVLLPVLVGPGVLRHGLAGQVHQDHPAHISAESRRHALPPMRSLSANNISF